MKKPFLVALVLLILLDILWGTTSSIHEESELVASFCEDPFYGITNEMDASIRTRQSSKGIEYFVDFRIRRSTENIVYSTTIEKKELEELLTAFKSLLAAYPTDKKKASKELSNVYEINREASIGYYFGYAFDDGWRFIVNEGFVWIDEKKLPEFYSFLQEVDKAIRAKI